MYIISSLAAITIEAKGNREEAQSRYALFYVVGNLLAFVTAGILSYVTGLIVVMSTLSLIGFTYSSFSFYYIPKEYNQLKNVNEIEAETMDRSIDRESSVEANVSF